jgi:hypothetical protein
MASPVTHWPSLKQPKAFRIFLLFIDAKHEIEVKEKVVNTTLS